MTVVRQKILPNIYSNRFFSEMSVFVRTSMRSEVIDIETHFEYFGDKKRPAKRYRDGNNLP